MDIVPDLEDAAYDLNNVAPVLEDVVDAASDLEPGLTGVFIIGERHFEFKSNYEGKMLGRGHHPL